MHRLVQFKIMQQIKAQQNNDTSDDNHNCSMVGLLGIMIQLGLAALSFSALIIKRYRENPKRPWKIWMFDTSKQIFSQILAHFINLTISLALSYNQANSDQCLWYFITNIFDNTMGVLICILLLKLVQKQLKKNRKFQLISGNYYKKIGEVQRQKLQQQKQFQQNRNNELKQRDLIGDDIFVMDVNKQKKTALIDQNSRRQALYIEKDQQNQNQSPNPINNNPQTNNNQGEEIYQEKVEYIIDYKAWLIQVGIWNGIVIIAKCCLFGLQFGLESQLQYFSVLILGWIEVYPVLQLIVVIVIVPVIMNGFAFWVQDNFLMKHQQESSQQKNLIQQNKRQQSLQQRQPRQVRIQMISKMHNQLVLQQM